MSDTCGCGHDCDCDRLTIKSLEEELSQARKGSDEAWEAYENIVKRNTDLVAELTRLRGAVMFAKDMIRLIEEGKPLPIEYLKKRFAEALEGKGHE